MVRIGQYGFPMMVNVIPEGRSGKFFIWHQVVTGEDVGRRKSFDARNGDLIRDEFQAPGEYCLLIKTDLANRQGDIIMSDTWFERSTNIEVVTKANGDVLIAGLGIGLILTLIVLKPEVKSVTVIEMNQDVINLTEKPLRQYLGGASAKLIVIQNDIFKWQPNKKYDTIYFDVWDHVYGDSYLDTEMLHRKFKYVLNRKNSNCWMNSWLWLRGGYRRLHLEY